MNLQREYIDECPADTRGISWEHCMDALGHNVTSHINENGPCSRCDTLQQPNEAQTKLWAVIFAFNQREDCVVRMNCTQSRAEELSYEYNTNLDRHGHEKGGHYFARQQKSTDVEGRHL